MADDLVRAVRRVPELDVGSAPTSPSSGGRSRLDRPHQADVNPNYDHEPDISQLPRYLNSTKRTDPQSPSGTSKLRKIEKSDLTAIYASSTYFIYYVLDAPCRRTGIRNGGNRCPMAA